MLRRLGLPWITKGALSCTLSALAALPAACSTSSSGSSCFSPVDGPSGSSCEGYSVGLSCPVDLEPWYTCVCTQTTSGTTWVCAPVNGSSASGTGGSASASSATTASASSGAGGADGG